jgi:HEAT repeat protein
MAMLLVFFSGLVIWGWTSPVARGWVLLWAGEPTQAWECGVEALPSPGAGKLLARTLCVVLLDSEAPMQLRWEAALTLGAVGPRAGSAVPDLVRILEDPDENDRLRWFAAQALGRLGPEARRAIPVLVDLSASDESLEKLWQHSEDRDSWCPWIDQGLDDLVNWWILEDRLWHWTAYGLADLGDEAWPALLEIIRTRDRQRFFVACYALMESTRGDAAASELLLAVVLDPQEAQDMRRCATIALTRHPPGGEAVPVLLEILEDSSDADREYLAALLGAMRGEASAAVPALIRALETGDQRSRLGVAWALARIGPEARVALPALRALREELQDEPGPNLLLCGALLQLDPEDPDAPGVMWDWLIQPTLLVPGSEIPPALSAWEPQLVRAAAPVAGPVLDDIVARLPRGSCRPAHHYPHAVLRWLGPAAKETVPDLLGELHSTTPWRRWRALRALLTIVPDDASVHQEIVDLLHSEDLEMDRRVHLAETAMWYQPTWAAPREVLTEHLGPELDNDPGDEDWVAFTAWSFIRSGVPAAR